MEEGSSVLPRAGHAARRSDLAAAGEHLSARGAGRVVRGRGEAADDGPARSWSVTPMTSSSSSPRKRRPAGDGGAAEAIRRVRLDASPGEDTAGAIPNGRGLTLVRRDGVGRGLARSTCWGSPTTGRRSRNGNWVIKRRTAKDRLSRALRKVSEWCRETPAPPAARSARGLVQKLRGHYAYYGITGNCAGAHAVSLRDSAIWRKWLNRRSQRARMPWDVSRCS